MRMLNDLGFGEISRIYVEEAGSAADIAARERMQYTLEDGGNQDGDVI